MPSARTTLRAAASRSYRRILPWALALAVATCSDDQNGPTRGGVGYFAFKPVYGVSNSLSQFGVVADSVHVLLTRPINQVVLDTTVFFAPDSSQLHLALPLQLETSPESLTAVIEIKSGGTILFVDSLEVQVADGVPSPANIPTVTLTYVGPGRNVAAITLAPGDTTIVLRDTLFFSASAIDSSDAPVTSFYTAWKTSDTSVAKINAQGRLIAPNLRGSVQVIGYTPTGIADTTLVTFAPVPTQILADSGTAQSGLVGDSLAANFVAKVLGGDNLPINGISVRFAAVTATGAIRDTLLVTDLTGRVRTRGVLGTVTGAYSYSATVVGTAITTSFTGTAGAGAPSAIAVDTGNAQVDSAGRALPVPFRVRVTDAFSNPTPGVKVYWLRTAGTGTLALDSSLTNGAGLATSGYTLGAVGIDSVTATIAGTGAFVAFQATTINGAAASISKFFGDAQTDTVGKLLADSMIVIVRSATNQPVVGTSVTWSVTRGGSTSNATTFTDVAGRTAVAYTLGTVTGIDSVKAQAGAASTTFTASALTGPATTLAISSGDAQTDTAARALPLPLVVRVTDLFSNPVNGAKLYWTRPVGTGALSADSTFTDAAGLASITYTLGTTGVDSVRATLAGTATVVSFTLTAVNGAPASIVTIQGDSQTITPNTTADTFAVRVRDAANQPVIGQKVDWSFIPAAGNFTTILPAGGLSSFTDSLGVARGIYSSANAAVSVRVEASIGVQLIDSLYVFIVPAAPSAITVQSGNGQADTTGHTLALPFVVRVADAFNNPTPGAKVYWTRVVGGGTLAADSTFTDAAGLTSVSYVLGASPSADTVTATIAGTSTFATFGATALDASPASVQAFAGDLQGDSAGKTIAPLVAIVRDAGSNPIVGTQVIWTVLRGGGLSVDTVLTDGSGLAQVTYTLGTATGIDSVRAQAGSAAVIFTAAVSNGAASAIAIQSGNNQTDTLGYAIPLPFVVRVADAFNNPVSGTKVAFTRIAGSGSLFADTLTTDAAGIASVGYTFGLVPGVDSIRADLVGTIANVHFAATAVAGVAATINAVSGDGQTDTALGTVAAPMVLQVLDGQDRQVPGAIVAFVGTGGVTPSQAVDTADLNGNVSVGITLGDTVGVWSVTAHVVAVPAVQAIYTFTTTPGAAALMAKVSGDGQTDTLGKALPLPFVVHVTDASGNDVAGAPVSFTVTAGAGALAGDTVLTSAAGLASIGYTLGAAPATNTVHVDLVGTGVKLDFTAFAVNAFATSITPVSGGGQSAAVTDGFTDSLDVVVKDAALAPIVNGTVIWSVSGGGLVLSTDTTFTDSLGHTHVRATAGTAAGTFTVFAQAVGLAPTANFSLTVTAGAAASMTYVSGNGQSDTVGHTLAAPFVVNVADAYGNPVSGAPVTFVRTIGTGTVLSDTVLSGPSGDANGSYTLGTIPGVDSIDATLVGVGTTLTFSATTLAGSPASLVLVSGNGQQDTAGHALSDSVVAEVKDGLGTPLAGIPVVWSVTIGGSFSADTVFTDAAGHAVDHYTLGTLAGTDSATVSIAGGALPTTFTAIVVNGVASQIAVQSGDGQVDTTGRTLPLPFTVVVYDAYNNPVAGQTVLFSVITGSGHFVIDSVVTNGAGLASSNYTLGTEAGLEDARATLKGTSAFIDFSATTVNGAPVLIAKLLGDNQADTVLSTLTDSLVVKLQDAASTGIPGHWIYWQTAGATVSADSTLTDANGRAAVAVTFGNVAIPIIVLARNVDTTLGAVFNLHATAGTLTQITAVAGNGQAGVINDTLPVDFRVLLQDANNNPAPAGVAVTWTNIVGFQPTGLPDTTVTDSLGVATLVKPLLSSFTGQDSLVAQIQGRPDSVIFTATTNAGAATSLTFVSGTGQTDTVGRSLSAPMVVQLRDVGNNPVVGAWVHWKIISGGGAVPLDSTQTDAAGAASSALTMGTVAGYDSISATFPALTDTVVFYELAENDTATSIAIFSGDAQSAFIGSAVPLPVVALVQDQYGNGVDGVPVTFTPSGLAGSVGNPVVSTDAAGQASSGSWTLDTLAGTNTLLAAAGALNKTAGAFALPIGTSKYWNGLTSTDWNTAANWSPVGVPIIGDNVFIPVSQPAPVLSADGVTTDLTLQAGGSLDVGANTLTVNGSLVEGGATMNGGGAVVLAGSGTIDQLNAVAVHVTGSYALTSSAVAQLGYLQIFPSGTLDLNGHALVVNGNLRQDGTLVMKAGSDSLDVLGNLDVTSTQTGAGNLTNGTMVLRGGLTQEFGATGNFQPTGNHTTVFVGAGQNVDFQYPDSTNDGSGSYFNIVHFADSTNFTTSVEFRGAVTVDTGKKVTSTGGTAGLSGALIGDAYADWSFNNTRFWATPASLPDSLRGSLELFNTTLTLTKPLAVGGAFRVSDNTSLTLGGQWVRVDSAFHSSGTGQIVMTNAADSLDIAGTATLDGGAGTFFDGVLLLRGDLSVPGASAVFQAANSHRTRFAGTATQQVAFASPSLATNRFNTVEFDNAAGVNFNSDAAVVTSAEVKQGQVTGPGTISMTGDLVDTTNNAWRPENTVWISSTGLLPTHFARSLELRGITALSTDFTVGGSLMLSGSAVLNANGHALTVDSNLVLTGGSAKLQMTNAADSVVVGFSTAFDGGDETGFLTAGVLVLHGDLTANQATPTFVAGGTHRTRLTADTATVSFPFSSGYTGNHFQDLELPNPAGTVLNALTDVYVDGTLLKPAGVASTIQAPSQVQLQAHGLQVDNLNFDNVRVVYSGSTALQFDNINFLTEDTTLAQLQLDLNGGTVTLNNTVFQVTPTSGYYVAVSDTEQNESSVQVNMYRSQPLDGAAHALEVGGNDGTTIKWSRMVFATEPVNIGAGDTLPAFRVAVLNPVGDTATWYAGTVTLSIGNNPLGGALAGTSAVAAVSGIATFSDISIDSAGFGYTLNASDLPGGVGPVSSVPFNLTVPAPVGFDVVWYGIGSSDWSQANNWSSGIVPDSSSNVFIPAGTPNAPVIATGDDSVHKLRVAPGATLTIGSGTTLATGGDVEAFGLINGTGTLLPSGTATLTGNISSVATIVGAIAVKGTATFGFNLTIGGSVGGSLTVGQDTLAVAGLLQTVNDGVLNMTTPGALVDVTGPAQFDGGTSGLFDGTFRLTGDLSTGGEHGDAFAPSGNHLTVLSGTGTQQVTFATADSVGGSHFARLQVSTAGLAFFNGRYDALGDVLVTTGATLSDSAHAGFVAHSGIAIDAGGTLAVYQLLSAGGVNPAVGSTYSVPVTTFFGSGAALPIGGFNFDTLEILRAAVASSDFLVTGDLRINGFGADAARLDLGGHTVAVSGAANINGNGALIEQNAADVLNVTGDFFTNGASTIGLLTAGTLQIGGNFRQAGDGSGSAFWATAGHLTRFTGGIGHRNIKFDNRAFGAADSSDSKFGDLELADGLDSLAQNGILAETVSIGGSVQYDTTYGGDITALGAVTLAANADTIHLSGLNTYVGITLVGTPTYLVNTTGFFGGTTLPLLAYQNLLVAGTTITLPSDLTISGNLITGVYNEVGPDLGGDVVVNGHVLTVGGLFTAGLGVFSMAPGDSVNDLGQLNFQGGNTAGHLTGGTLVVRSNFSVGNTGGDSAFVASGSHTTVLAAPGTSVFTSNASSDGGTQFGYLLSLDGGVRTINGSRRITADSITLGSATSGLSYASASITSRGQVFTVAGSDLTLGELRVDGALSVAGSYTVTTTYFTGAGQAVPKLPYGSVAIEGTAYLADSLTLASTDYLVIGQGTLPSNLDVNGKPVRVGSLFTTGFGTLTMDSPADTVEALVQTTFDGGDETGKLTDGLLLLRGNFTQASNTTDSSFVATGAHQTHFADTSGVMAISANSMFAGASRFNDVTISGQGVAFNGQMWVGRNVAIPAPTAQSISGGTVTIGGSLSDAGPTAYDWLVDTTLFLSRNASLPDSMNKLVILAGGDTLHTNLRVGGQLVLQDTTVVNGFTVVAHGGLAVTGPGALQMTNSTDDVTVDGQATFEGAPNTGLMTAGRLTLHGDLVTGNVNAGAFNASGSHVTVFNGGVTQSIIVVPGSQPSAFNDVVTYNDLNIPNGLQALGTFRDSVAGMLTLSGSVGSQPALAAARVEITDAQFTDLSVTMGEQSKLDDAVLSFAAPSLITPILVVGGGQEGSLDLHAITFTDWAGATQLVRVVDTADNELGIHIRMFGSVPFDGSTKTVIFAPSDPGLSSVAWSHLVMGGPLPPTLDSLVPFTVSMLVQGPDTAYVNSVGGTVDVSLVNDTSGAALIGSTSVPFDGSSANFFLRVDKPQAGLALHFEIQGRAIDSVNSAPVDVINPSPTQAIVWDGGASDGLWTSGANWSGDLVPTESDSVFIPGGVSVTFDSPNDTIATLVLGSGAMLTILPNDSLFTFGRVAAGNTISGAGTLVLAGALQQVSGTFPNTSITGTVIAQGIMTVNGSLTIDGVGAELNVGGGHVFISNSLTTINGGLLTMDGADTVYTSDASFQGGDETGRLIDGLLLIQGTGITQGGPEPRSFRTGGTFTTIFGSFGGASTATFQDPDSSNLAQVKVENPNGTTFSSTTGHVLISGDLTASAFGAIFGDTVKVDGTLTVGGTESITAGELDLGLAPSITGGYTVGNTAYFGAPVVVPAVPGGYQSLTLATDASLAGPVDAVTVYASGGDFSPNGNTLHTQNFWTQGIGRLVMMNAADTLIADSSAIFQGNSEKNFLTAGTVLLGGNLIAVGSSTGGKYWAIPGHVTKFFGPTPHGMTVSFGCEESCNTAPIQFGTLVIDTGSVSINDPDGAGVQVNDTLQLNSGQLLGSGKTVMVHGPVVADEPSYLKLANLDVHDSVAIVVNDTAYAVNNTIYSGQNHRIAPLPYFTLTVSGGPHLDTTITAAYVNLVGEGDLTLAGHTLVADSQFTADSASHLYMNDPLDSLIAPQYAVFKSENTEGDFTNGVILARHFIQMAGPTGSSLGFVQTDSNRLVPMAGDTIEMQDAGPADSRLKSIDFSSAAGTVNVRGLWVTDTAWVNNSATAVNADTGFVFYVGSHLIQSDGAFNVPRFAIGGTIDYTGGSYVVDTTVFAGAGQSIFNNVPYANIVVQYSAALAGGRLDLRTGGHSLRVENTGQLDLAGHALEATEFRTTGFGQLKMADPLDSLVAFAVVFDGDSTNGLLTEGVIRTPLLQQLADNSNRSYAPSGNHRLVLEDLGLDISDVSARFATPEATTGSNANILVMAGYQVGMYTNIVTTDSLLISTQINDEVGHTVTAYGPVVIGSTANVTLDSLIIHDTLIVDPSATYSVNNTVFAPGAGPLPSGVVYKSIFIDGAQTLADTLAANNSIFVRQGGVLTPNGHKVVSAGGFNVLENAHLVMAAGDTVDVGNASFDGAASTTDLAGGVLRIRNGLFSGNSTNSETFVPTGMVTEFYGGGTASVASNAAPQSYINDLQVIDGTTIQPTTYFLVMGPAVFKNGSHFDGNSAPAALDFRGKVTVLDTSSFVSVNTVFFADSLTMATPNFYSVASTRFDGTAGIPDLPYQGLIIDGVQTTLTHRIAASGQMIITGTTPGATKLTLGGFALSAGTLDISGYARVEMNDPNDSLVSTGTMTFAGEDESGLLTAGYLRVAGDLHQNGFYSPKNLRTDGARVEFYGPTSHLLTFDNPDTAASYIGNVAILGGGNLFLNTASVFKGRVDVGVSSKLDLGTLSAANSDFYAPVTVASGGTFKNTSMGMVTFHDTLLVDPAATYNVVNTAFNEIDTLPNLAYQNLYLRDGTNITLHENIATSGLLSLDAAALGDQELTLNGHQLIVGGNFITQQNGRVTMTTAGDVLAVAGDANFWGGDEAGHLTAGAIVVANAFSQQAAHSDRSFRSTGTLVQFPFSGSAHEIGFTTPDSSYFANVTTSITDPLSLNITGRMKATGTVHGYNTTVTGDTLEVGTLSAGPGGGSVNLKHLVAGQILGTFGSFVAPVTTLFGSGVVPALPYDTLILAGRDSVTIGAVTANQIIVQDSAYIGTGALLQSAGDLVIDGSSAVLENDGGLLSVAGTLSTGNGGVLMSQNIANTMSVKHAVWNGGNEIGLLTAGTLSVNGDFSILTGSPTFRADSLFTVNFVGGRAHDLNIGVWGPVQYFGELGIHSSLDTLNFTFAGELQVYKLSATGGSVINSSLNGISAERLAVNGAVFNETPIHVNTLSDQPEAFDNATFTGFSASDIQLFFEHPSHAGSFTFNGIDFDNVTVSPSGYFLLTHRTDASGSFTINMGSPFDYTSGILHTLLGTPGGSTLVNWALGF